MLKEEALKALDIMRPNQDCDAGRVDLVSVDDVGKKVGDIAGACGSCPFTNLTTR